MQRIIRKALIAEFWGSVRSRLIKHHHHSAENADHGIAQYRHAVEERKVGDLVYHQGVEQASIAIDNILRDGTQCRPSKPASRKKSKKVG